MFDYLGNPVPEIQRCAEMPKDSVNKSLITIGKLASNEEESYEVFCRGSIRWQLLKQGNLKCARLTFPVFAN